MDPQLRTLAMSEKLFTRDPSGVFEHLCLQIQQCT
jgi:hypothetical protein